MKKKKTAAKQGVSRATEETRQVRDERIEDRDVKTGKDDLSGKDAEEENGKDNGPAGNTQAEAGKNNGPAGNTQPKAGKNDCPAETKEKAGKKRNFADKKERRRKECSGKRQKIMDALSLAAVTVFQVLISVAAVYLYGKSIEEQIRICVTVGLFSLLFLFSEVRNRIVGDYLHNNGIHRGRFYAAYLLLLGISCMFPMFTRTGWPFLFIAVVLTLLSNSTTGMISYVQILSFASLLGNADLNTFLTYFFSGMCVVILFSVVDQSFRIEIPLILSLLCYLVSLCANVIITQNANLTFQMFIVPCISLFLNTVLILMFLWYANSAVVSREKNRYVEINDPEFELMIRIKQAGSDYYYHAIHTAYLCNKIAVRLSLNPDAVRAAGFYHGAGIIKGADTAENLMEVLKEYEFPEKVCEILREYKRNGKVSGKETAVVMMSAAVIDSIMYLFSQNKDAKIRYDEVIRLLFQKKTEKGTFDQCDISIREMNIMKKILMEENLYYDFLR